MTSIGSRRTTFLVGALLLGHAVLLLLAAVPSLRNALWGFNAWTFLSPLMVGLALLLAVLLTGLLRFGRPRGRAGFLLGAGVAALLVIACRDATHLLGDGQLWLAAIRERPAHHPHEPLAFGLAALVTRGDPMGTRLTWLSHAVGLATLGILWRLAGRLVPTTGGSVDRRWIFALMASAGATLLAFGYIEAYPTLGLVVMALLLSLIGYVQGRTGAAPVGFLLGLAVATHALALAMAPAVLVAFRRRRPAWSSIGVSILLFLIPVAFAWMILPILFPAGGDSGRHWSRLLLDLSFYRWGVPAWFLEQVNRWGLVAGAAPALLAAWLLARAGSPTKGHPGLDDESLVLGAAAVGLMAPALLLDVEGSRGAAADWDAFAIAGWPLAALVARLVVSADPSSGDASPTPSPRTASPVYWLAPLLGLFGLLAAALVAHRPEAAGARFEALIRHSFRTPRARSWGWETMAAWKREAKDMPGAARAYQEALDQQPRNVRLLRNAAGALGRLGESRRAADLLVRLTEEVPGDAGAWLHLGLELNRVGSTDSSRVSLRRALAIDPDRLDARNELARSLLRSPETRREARELIARSLEQAPSQDHAPELRETLERLDRDGYGPAGNP